MNLKHNTWQSQRASELAVFNHLDVQPSRPVVPNFNLVDLTACLSQVKDSRNSHGTHSVTLGYLGRLTGGSGQTGLIFLGTPAKMVVFGIRFGVFGKNNEKAFGAPNKMGHH